MFFFCGFGGGELPLGTEQSEPFEFFGPKSRSDVIALQSYRPRSQLQKASVHHKINSFTGSWDLGSISRNVLAAAMREVNPCESSGAEPFHGPCPRDPCEH